MPRTKKISKTTTRKGLSLNERFGSKRHEVDMSSKEFFWSVENELTVMYGRRMVHAEHGWWY